MTSVVTAEHTRQASRVRSWLAALRTNDDLLSVGAYVAGTQPVLDAALARRDALRTFLCQPADTLCSLSDALAGLAGLAGAD